MKMIKFILSGVIAFSLLSVSAQSNSAKGKSSESIKKGGKKPNIIYILADDLGTGNVSAYDADIFKTPCIDKLARTGIQYNHAYTAPLCGPSRALILTGRYAFRTGATNQDATGTMKPEVEVMMPKVLKTAGYITSMVGKWGQLPLGPAEFGFDDYLRFKGSGVYWSTSEKAQNYTENGENKTLMPNEYMPDLMHDHLVKFLATNKDKPFYVYYSLSHVHGEIVRTPDSKPNSKDLYSDNIDYMDKEVAKLLKVLDSLKLRDNTVIMFMGDNGTAGGEALRSTRQGKHLIGQKGSMKECGSLVPMIVNWPGVITKPRITDQLIDASDLMPTLAEIAGAKLPDSVVLDGTSFLPQILGKKGKERDWIFMELASDWYAREAKWKLNRAGELYDMKNSPFEENLVAADTKDAEAVAARVRLQAVLDKLNPAGGILDSGDGTGRHANKSANKSKKAKRAKAKEAAAEGQSAAVDTDNSNAGESNDRLAKYNKIKTKCGGIVTRDNFIHTSPNPESAGERFDKLDTNHDGIVTEEEFMKAAKK